jgi:hypothetical protein
MNKILTLLFLITFFFSCGPTPEELKKQKEEELTIRYQNEMAKPLIRNEYDNVALKMHYTETIKKGGNNFKVFNIQNFNYKELVQKWGKPNVIKFTQHSDAIWYFMWFPSDKLKITDENLDGINYMQLMVYNYISDEQGRYNISESLGYDFDGVEGNEWCDKIHEYMMNNPIPRKSDFSIQNRKFNSVEDAITDELKPTESTYLRSLTCQP